MSRGFRNNAFFIFESGRRTYPAVNCERISPTWDHSKRHKNNKIINIYDKSCVEVKYEDLARNPDNYKGQNLVFTGEVIQCEQSYETNYYARVNVTLNEYDYYEDTIYVTFELPEGADKILEEDIVKLYGVCQGSETYTSIFGESITIPSLDAAYVELLK